MITKLALIKRKFEIKLLKKPLRINTSDHQFGIVSLKKMYSDKSEGSRGSEYAQFSAISSSIDSKQSIAIYTVISNSTSTTYDKISEGFYDRQTGKFITPKSGRQGKLPRIKDDNPDHVEQKNSNSNKEHTRDSKRPCIIVILSVFAVVISTTVATIAVLYLQGQDSPNDDGNMLRLNRSYLRKNNGTEIFSDCKDLKLFGNDSDGLYTVYPDPLTETPVVVYCDMTTDGGGWTVFQHRRDGSVNFYRQWDSYKNGFGEASGEHWIGNDNLHKLTTLGTTELYVRLEAFSGDWYYAKYGDFKVADESDGYNLSLKAGSYEGNAGDGMDNHGSTDPSGMQFSTIDIDNDNAPARCTFARQGAWWYNQCTLTNLNGIYGNGDCLTAEQCNFWYLISSSYVGVKTSYIMVRRLENQFYCAKCPSSK
ncbi:angiopoietin-related protein 1-like [Crassostrea angulata]|uniref:angiopoietin-related protein 1-like n=1 Tax=Magallana angulata TaxID=2784310 RepID=UPI0022B1697B|nr:angiopoietin-related protein 1-like [Crassostrea angulata]